MTAIPQLALSERIQSVDQTKYIALLEENASLKDQLATLSKSPEIFPGALDTIQLTITDGFPSSTPVVIDKTWAAIFLILAESIIDGEPTVDYIARNIIGDSDGISGFEEILEFTNIRRNLFRLKLVDFSGGSVWSLTEYGRQQYFLLRQDR